MVKKGLSKTMFLAVLCTFFTASAQILIKIGVNRKIDSLISVINNIPLLCGLFFYFIGALLLIYALKKDALSSVYPIISLSFIWVALLSVIFLGESFLIWQQWVGILVIISGVIIVTRGATHA